MFMFEYRKNPRLFWLTIAALVVAIVIACPPAKCSDFKGQTWDDATNSPVMCTNK